MAVLNGHYTYSYNMTSTGDVMRVQFWSDGDVVDKGFRAVYTATGKSMVYTCSTYFKIMRNQ